MNSSSKQREKFYSFNSHYHGIVLEGGFDEEGNFFFIPFGNLDKIRLVLQEE